MKKHVEEPVNPANERHPMIPPRSSENGKTKSSRTSEKGKSNLRKTHSPEAHHRIDDEQPGPFPAGNGSGRHIPSGDPW